MPLNHPLSLRLSEKIRFAVAPQSPLYEVDQLNNALSALDVTIRTDHSIEEGYFQPASQFRFLWMMNSLEFGMVTYEEKGVVVKTTEVSSPQPTSKLWERFDAQIPVFDPETETFPREVSIIMYPDKDFARRSFEPKEPIYRIEMAKLRAHQREYNKTGLLV